MSAASENVTVIMKSESDMAKFREMFPRILEDDLYCVLTDNVITQEGIYRLLIDGEPLFNDPFSDGTNVGSMIRKYVEALPQSQFTASYTNESSRDGSYTRKYWNYSNGVLKEMTILTEFPLDLVVCSCGKPLGTMEYPCFKEEESEIVCSECENTLLSNEENADITETIETYSDNHWKTIHDSSLDFDDDSSSNFTIQLEIFTKPMGIIRYMNTGCDEEGIEVNFSASPKQLGSCKTIEELIKLIRSSADEENGFWDNSDLFDDDSLSCSEETFFSKLSALKGMDEISKIMVSCWEEGLSDDFSREYTYDLATGKYTAIYKGTENSVGHAGDLLISDEDECEIGEE